MNVDPVTPHVAGMIRKRDERIAYLENLILNWQANRHGGHENRALINEAHSIAHHRKPADEETKP